MKTKTLKQSIFIIIDNNSKLIIVANVSSFREHMTDKLGIVLNVSNSSPHGINGDQLLFSVSLCRRQH